MNLQVPLYLIVVLVAVATGKATGKPGCLGPVFKINDAYYIRETLKTIHDVDFMSFDQSTNTLYLIFHNEMPYEMFAGKINLNTNEFQNVTFDDIFKLHWSVNKKTNDVYIAGRKAIYKYNSNSNKVEPFVVQNSTEYFDFHMFYTKDDALYFSGFPSWTVYKVENGEITKFNDLESKPVRNLVIDDDNNMFYTSNGGLYKQKKGTKEAVYIADAEDLGLEGLALDNIGNLYAAAGNDGLYIVKKNTNKIESVFDETARAVTFDGDNNMIYSDYDNLYRFKLNTDTQCI